MPAATPPDLELIEITLQDGIATVALNRPDKLNAMNDDLRAAFIEAMEWAAAENEVRALIVTGKGRAFCAGGDIAGMKQRLEAPAFRAAGRRGRQGGRCGGRAGGVKKNPAPSLDA